jgi:hypothetical protein
VFIDNSIEASQGNADARNIELGLDLNYNGDAESYISILDNGEGMDRDTLSDFAVYSLDKESRGLKPANENASNISKFGVGAKQAGFYLGSRIHVLTSTAGSSIVLELTLDRDVIEKRFHNKEDVYKGKITSHHASSASAAATSDYVKDRYNPRLQQVVNSLFEQKLQHSEEEEIDFAFSFTLITVQLRKEIKRKLHRDKTFLNLPTQLADIYHFHLHPENLPNTTL